MMSCASAMVSMASTISSGTLCRRSSSFWSSVGAVMWPMTASHSSVENCATLRATTR